MNTNGYKRVSRNIQLQTTKNDSTNRFATKTVPNKKKNVKKFDYKKDL